MAENPYSFTNLLRPFTDIFKRPQQPFFTPTPKKPLRPFSAPQVPNASTPTGPAYFAPPVIPQVKAPTSTPTFGGGAFGGGGATTTAPAAPVAPIAPALPAQPPQVAAPAAGPTPLSPEAQKAVQDAELARQQAAQISPAELSTQEDIDKLAESTRKAFTNIQGQPIPLEFITGQLASVERRALDLAEPLERKLARLQAARTSSLEASKFALERADKRAEIERKEAETATTQAESRRQFDVNYQLSQEKFEEDKRQFGITTAQKNREIAIDEAKASAEAGGDSKKSDMLSNLSLVESLLGNSSLGAITGVPAPTAFLPGTQAQVAKNQYQQIKGILALDKRKLLKGSGQISDYESRVLDQAASALGRNLSDADFVKELKRIRGVFTTAAGLEAPVKVTNRATGEIIKASASRAEIDQLIAEGNQVEYE